MKGERIAIICLTAGLIAVGATTYTGKERTCNYNS